jgi:hypothetical protein
MADIRQKVEEDRGILKKIQLIIPGYRGYRIREDLRDSDKMLRMELVKRLGSQRNKVDDARSEIVRIAPLSKNVELIGNIDMQMKKLMGVIDHAETGYSGFVADIKMGALELNQLYDYDLMILQNIIKVDQSLESLASSISSEDEKMIRDDLRMIKKELDAFEEKYSSRISIIQGTAQVKGA